MPTTEPPMPVLSSSLRYLLILLPAATLITASLGAWTRLADAGLGCPDWPGCYGFALLPSGEQEIQLAESRYPQTPYEADKALPEVVHRYIAALTGLLIWLALAMMLFSRRQPAPLHTRQRRSLLILMWAAAVAVCVQGLFGYLTVSLKLWPQIVTAHLFGGLLVLSLTWLMVLQALLRPDRPPQLGRIAWSALVLLLMQIGLGVWVSSNYAAVACTDFPLCQGQWLPPTDFSEGFSLSTPPGANYLHGQLGNHARTAIHLSHRVGALVASIGLIALAVCALRQGLIGRGVTLLLLLAGQFLLGVLNVLLTLPLPIALGHHLGAALLLLTVISLLPDRAPTTPATSAPPAI